MALDLHHGGSGRENREGKVGQRITTAARRTAIVIVALATTLAAAAQATVIVQGHDFAISRHVSAAPPYGSSVAPELVSYDLFDSTLGTLNSATWVLRNANSGFTVLADGGALNYLHAVSVFGYADAYGQAGGPGGLRGTTSLLTLGSSNSASCAVDVIGYVFFFSPFGCTATASGGDNLLLDSRTADAAAFIGSGSFSEPVAMYYNWSSSVSVDSFGPANIVGPTVLGDFAISGRLELEYDYTPSEVPEPEAHLLVLGGLTLLGIAGRRRKPPMARRVLSS